MQRFGYEKKKHYLLEKICKFSLTLNKISSSESLPYEIQVFYFESPKISVYYDIGNKCRG